MEFPGTWYLHYVIGLSVTAQLIWQIAALRMQSERYYKCPNTCYPRHSSCRVAVTCFVTYKHINFLASLIIVRQTKPSGFTIGLSKVSANKEIKTDFRQGTASMPIQNVNFGMYIHFCSLKVPERYAKCLRASSSVKGKLLSAPPSGR